MQILSNKNKKWKIIMCLAIPGKVIEIDTSSKPLMGKVSFGGVQKNICLDWIPDVKVGEYIIAHVGFALNKIDEEEAKETLKLFEQMSEKMDDIKNSEIV
jgi:hydrogenase expression/formation protein HypC